MIKISACEADVFKYFLILSVALRSRNHVKLLLVFRYCSYDVYQKFSISFTTILCLI